MQSKIFHLLVLENLLLMSVFNRICNRLRLFLSPGKGDKHVVYPQEEFEMDVMDEVVELREMVKQLAGTVIMQQTQISSMQTQLTQIIGHQYQNCQVVNGTNITNIYNGQSSQEPDASSAPLYPRKGKYQEVLEWLEKKKMKGEDLYAGCGYNRSALCRKLSKIFGWEVDESGLRKAEMAQKM